jgi:hypothetical protein
MAQNAAPPAKDTPLVEESPPASPPSPPRPEPPPPPPPKPTYRNFDPYAKAYPDAEPMRGKLGVGYFKNYALFPINPEKQARHLPGGYLWASIDSFAPGTFKDPHRPLHWVSVFDGWDSLRKWCYTEHEALEALEELAVLTPEDFQEIEQMGYKKEA